MSARAWTGIAGLIVGLALLALLFTQLGFTLAELGTLLLRTPLWLVSVVTILTLCVQIICSLRWRLVMAWLRPDLAIPPVRGAVNATSWGSFFGQFLPIQLAMPAARWFSARNGSAVGSTLYEGLFDFVILASGGVAAALVLLAGFGPVAGALCFIAGLTLGCLLLRPGLSLLHWLIGGWEKARLPLHARLAALEEPMQRIIDAPRGLIAPLAIWSVVKLAVLSARLLLIAWVFAAPIDAVLVAIGYPIVGLTLGVPFIPAGLGLADWSWTGILVLAGAAAAIAGLTALAARVLNFVALLIIVALVMPLWRLIDGLSPPPPHRSQPST